MLMQTDQTYSAVSFTVDTGQLELPLKLEFASGLVGLPDATVATLQKLPGQEPFMWLSFEGLADPINFLVIEPNGLVSNYSPELFDQDADELAITDSGDAFVLNIVTLRDTVPASASVNLTGPIIINRRTLQAKQVVISNYMGYRTPYILGEA
jgi:flagellar assembly factor FliW